ncbi:MAG: prolipoprotein diacylglyceryl transferase family protein [Desulfosalsimonas sp.]
MFRYLGLRQAFPHIIEPAGPVVYYGLILAAVGFSVFLILRRLRQRGYGGKQLTVILLFTLFAAFPAGFAASKAAAMFYSPPDFWSLRLLAEQALSGNSHTYHAVVIVSGLLLLGFFKAMRYKAAEILDTVFLYLPAAHALGRTGCLFIGCCWGRYTRLDFFGLCTVDFVNPVPLYSILANILIFLGLRRVYNGVYTANRPAEEERRLAGSAAGMYLVLYGSVRIALEVFRPVQEVVLGFTQAQAAMAGFAAAGGVILVKKALNLRQIKTERDRREDSDNDLSGIFSLAGLVAVYLIIFAVTLNLKEVGVLPWPFERAASLGGAFFAVFYYVPFLFFPAVCFFWLKASGMGIRDAFRAPVFHPVFVLAVAVSIGYSVYLLFPGIAGRGPATLWIPVAVLSTMNAAGEEFAFRHAFLNMFAHAGYGKVSANGFQGILYGLPHFVIGGAAFGIFAVLYGWLLGWVRYRSASLIPCIICHFLIDIGCIGAPMLY